VLVEKPLALTRRDAQAMVQAAERTKQILMVNYQRRGNGLLRAAKQVLSDGMIGRIHQVNLALTYYFRWWLQPGSSEETGLIAGAAQSTGLPEAFFSEWARWHTDPARMGGGAFVDTGSHFVDVALWLAGSGPGSAGPRDVVAFSNPPNSRIEQFINVQARLDNEVLFSMTAGDSNTGRIGPDFQRLSVIGEDGVLEGNLDELWLNRRGERTKVEPMAEVRIADAFTSAICDGGLNISPARDAEQVVALTEAAYQSAVGGNIVSVK
jgi:predicted dehydrogenase